MLTNTRFPCTLLAAAAFTLLASSCSSSKLPKTELDRLRNLQPSAETALIYFVRPVALGAAIRMELTCDGTDIGSTQGKQFVYTLAKPGKHDFTSSAENKARMSMVVEAGKTYFIQQQVEMGLLIARTDLERLGDAEGRQKLARCKLSSDCPTYSSTPK